MRKIEFRAKCIDNGEWVYGYYLAVAGTHKILSFNPDSPSGATYYDVDPHTVGQNTGIEDCNGKFIFEDDIVNYGSTRGDVTWCELLAAFYVEFHTLGGEMEIVGNIHDNPRLLTKYTE